MNDLEFSQLMIERVEIARRDAELDKQTKLVRSRAIELDEQIKAHVLELGETQKLAGVTATYYGESIHTSAGGYRSARPARVGIKVKS